MPALLQMKGAGGWLNALTKENLVVTVPNRVCGARSGPVPEMKRPGGKPDMQKCLILSADVPVTIEMKTDKSSNLSPRARGVGQERFANFLHILINQKNC
jgi:hypothetical protein